MTRAHRSRRTTVPLAFALALLSMLILPALAPAAEPAWTQQSPATSPPGRSAASLAYDTATGQTILFGGNDSGSLFNDTWTWDGTDWRRLSPPTSPRARENASMAFDPATGQLILFGGLDSSASALGDTWNWDGTNWTQLSPANAPSARVGASLAYDTATDQLVLFGGEGNSGKTNETWTWDGTNWTQLSPATSPPARTFASMAFDQTSGQLLLFGGWAGNAADLNDTWSWDGTNWTQLSPSHSPPTRLLSTMEFDPAIGKMLLFGGLSEGSELGDSWSWDGLDWTEETPSVAPSARGESAMTFDAATGQIVLFGGGDSSGTLGDTWTFQAPVEPIARITSPPGGGTFSLGQDVPTAFECTDAGGPGIESCTDSGGATGGKGRLDTSTLGPHTYTVTAVSTNGTRDEASIVYTVVAAPATVPATVPATGSGQSPNPPPAGGWFGIRKVDRNLGRGSARLTIVFTGSGEVDLSGKGVKSSVTQVSNGIGRLRVLPTGGTKTKLMRTGTAKVTVTVVFKTAGNVWTKTKSLAIRQG